MKTSAFSLSLLILLIAMCFIPPVHAAEGSEFRYTSTMIYINQGDSVLQLPEEYGDLTLFPNTTWQTTILTNLTHPFTLTRDNDQNLRVKLGNLTIAPGANITVSYSLRILKSPQTSPSVTLETASTLSNIPPDLNEYTEAHGSWQVDDPELRALATSIWAEADHTPNVLRVVQALADWIGTHITPQSHEYPLYPNQTYTQGTGDCDDQANLLITLCRILDIPAYLRVGCIQNSKTVEASYWDGHVTTTLHNIGYHGWAMIYIPPWGWLPFDMTLGWSADTLNGITAAMAWKPNVLTLMNIQTSDWAGDSRSHYQFTIANDLYLLNEDQLIRENPEVPLDLLIWVGSGALIVGGGYLLSKKLRNSGRAR